MTDPADQRTADRETIVRALIEAERGKMSDPSSHASARIRSAGTRTASTASAYLTFADALPDRLTDAGRRLAVELDAYLLSVFGSVENAQRHAGLFVLEEWPPEFIKDGQTVTIRQQYRLRLKTEEELAAEASTGRLAG